MPNMFVKLSVTYYDDIAIVVADDAAEVMFTRGLALCGRLRSGGFIPDAKITELSRRTRSATAKKIADRLCAPPAPGVDAPWMRVEGGYQVRNWATWQDRLDALEERRRTDRERQRNRRTRGKKADSSRDSHVSVTDTEEEKEEETAAAAAVPPRSGGSDATHEHPSIAIFADKLRALTHFRALRFDKLTPAQADTLAELIDLHGDGPLIKVAVDTARPTPPQFAQALLGTWAALPAPGHRLAVVDEPRCWDCNEIGRAHPWPGCHTFRKSEAS